MRRSNPTISSFASFFLNPCVRDTEVRSLNKIFSNETQRSHVFLLFYLPPCYSAEILRRGDSKLYTVLRDDAMNNGRTRVKWSARFTFSLSLTKDRIHWNWMRSRVSRPEIPIRRKKSLAHSTLNSGDSGNYIKQNGGNW